MRKKEYIKKKEYLDIYLSLMALFFLAPVFLTLVIAIKLDSPGPVFFKQKRVGIHQKHFKILKFRTMRTDTPKDMPTHLLQDPDQYITKVGKFLRKTSLDELPQLINIVKGEMSIIGPRPALWNQYDLIEEREKYGANDILPGLTGWAQIHGRDELDIPEKAKLDGYYVDNLSFGLDVKCFFGTILSVLRSDGVVEGGTGEMKRKEVEKMGKKILILSNHFITIFAFRKEVIQRMIEAGNEVYISTPADEQNKYFEDMGCLIIETSMNRRGTNPFKDLQLIGKYKKIMKQVNPEIIFSYTVKPNIYGSIASNSLKFKQVCNITGTGSTFLKESVLSKNVRMLYKVSVKRCYKVFFQNKGDKQYFVEHKMVGKNIELIPGSGVNLVEHEFTEMPSDGVVNFIFIGRVMEVKGVDQYLDCAKEIHENYPNTCFYIAGWNEEEKYKKLVEEYQNKGCVNYIGFQKDIDSWIRKCHCTILPSLGGEGVPNVLLESAATGRACIASAINGSKDVIDDGVTGYLYEVGNSQSLIEKVEEFLKLSFEEKRAMGIAGHNKMTREFNREIVISKYMDEVKKA